MENAAEALKIGFGVIVFAVALTVLFRMTSLIKGTSEEVFSSIDKTTYIDYTVDTSNIDTNTGKRIVSFTDIIPTIYRYSQEGYGVTIIDKISDNNYKIVARFDLSTESQVASCIWKESDFNNSSIRSKVNQVKYSLTKYIKTNIYDVAGIMIPEDLERQAYDDYDTGSTFERFSWLNSLITKIYGTGAINNRTPIVYTSWASSNRYSNNYITQRINCDLYGGITYFNAQYPGVSNSNLENLGQHKAYYSNGLLSEYKNSQFIEYITEVDQNAYIIDEDGNLTDLLQYGTIRYAKQRELIYVEK